MANKYNHSNFAIGTVLGTFTAGQTLLDLTTNHGNRFPTAPFRATLWNATDYTNPSDAFWAGEAEIIECGGKTASSLTSLTRGRENTSGIASTPAKVYRVICAITNNDIENYNYLFNVKDFGAVGNANTEDTVAIQEAIDAAAVLGGEVFFPTGIYVVSTITMGSGVHLIGSGFSTILKAEDTVAGHSVIEVLYKSNWSIENLKIDGGSISSTHCIRTMGTGGDCSKFRLKNLWLLNGGYRTLNIRSGIDSEIENIIVEGKGGDCSFLIGTNTGETFTCSNIKIRNLTIKDVDTDGGGIWRQNDTGTVQNIFINGLYISRTGVTTSGMGFFTHDVYDVSISDFIIRDGQHANGNGLNIEGGARFRISNGLIKDYLLYGLTLSGASPSDMSFSNITFHGNQRGVVIEGNTTTPAIRIQFNNCIAYQQKFDGFWGAGSFVQWNNCISYDNGQSAGYYAGWMMQSTTSQAKPYNHQFNGCRAFDSGGNKQKYGINFGDNCEEIYIDGNTRFHGFTSAVYHSNGNTVDDVFWALGRGATEWIKNVNGSAAPTTGTWAVGDICWNTVPAAGGYLGWVCTTAGTPGTWKTFGAITA